MKVSAVVTCAFALLLSPVAQSAVTFTANLTPEQVVPLNGATSPAGISHASAVGTFVLDLDAPSVNLTYEIVFFGLSLENDVQGIHFHIGVPPGTPPPGGSDIGTRHSDGSVNGPHALNVYGLPRQDDADMVANFTTNTITGVWDNNDFNYGLDGIRDPGDSVSVGAIVDELFEGHIYIQVHTFAFPVPNTGELRGQIYQVPEPSRILLIGAALGLIALRRSHLPSKRPPVKPEALDM